MDYFDVDGILFENRAFGQRLEYKITCNPKDTDNYERALLFNGLHASFMVGNPEESTDLHIIVYSKEKRASNEELPLYFIDVWDIDELKERFFANSFIDLNYLLKELQPIIQIAQHNEHMENLKIHKA